MWKPLVLAIALATSSCVIAIGNRGEEMEGCCTPTEECACEAEEACEVEVEADEVGAAAAADYPLTVCVVSGESLPAEGYATAVIGDRELRFCCPSCASAAEKDPAGTQAEFASMVMDSQRADYPLDTCVVAGSPLGGMGEPHEMLVNDTLVRLCCAGCAGKVKADPDTYLAKIDAARSK